MVKKSKTTDSLTINTAVKKTVESKTIVNLSRILSIPVEYVVNGQRTTFMLPPVSRQVIPGEAEVLTQHKELKVV